MGRPLVELGLDSLMALELRAQLEADTGGRVPILFLLECRSGDALVERLRDGGQGRADGGEEREEIRL